MILLTNSINMDADQLQKLGLSRNEAKIYLALLEIGAAQAGLLSKRTQINRTTTYDAIERLIEKGLVSYALQAGRKVFKPSSPEKLMENLQEQQKFGEEIIPELQKIYSSAKEKEESAIYEGRKGIRSILQDILKHKEYVSLGSSGEFLDIMKHDFTLFQRQKKALGVKSRVILPDKLRHKEIVTSATASFKFIPDQFAAPTTTWIYGEKIAIVIWSDTPTATVIKSRKVAQSYRSYFELLWKQAKK